MQQGDADAMSLVSIVINKGLSLIFKTTPIANRTNAHHTPLERKYEKARQGPYLN